jgi:hypothetical protein
MGWLYQRAMDRAVQIERELLVRPAVFPDPARARAALRNRERLGLARPPWALIRFFAQSRVAGPADPLTSGRSRPALPEGAVTVPSI